MQLEKHIVWLGEQNRLKQIWGLRGPEPVLLSSLMCSCPWQHRSGWGWDAEDIKGRKYLSFPFLKGLSSQLGISRLKALSSN